MVTPSQPLQLPDGPLAPHAHWACALTPSTKSSHPTSADTAPLRTFCLAPVFQEWGRGRRGGWSTQRVLSQVRALGPSPGDLPHSSSRALPWWLCPRPSRSVLPAEITPSQRPHPASHLPAAAIRPPESPPNHPAPPYVNPTLSLHLYIYVYVYVYVYVYIYNMRLLIVLGLRGGSH